MNLAEEINRRLYKHGKVERLPGNPYGIRNTFLGNPDVVRMQNVEECKAWMSGDGNEILNHYTAEDAYGFYQNPIYNRNKPQFFWAVAANEAMKRVHSGVTKASIDMMTYIIGTPRIESQTFPDAWDKIAKETKLKKLITQRQIPLTLGLGYGAFKPLITKTSKTPLVEFYDAECVDFRWEHGKCVEVIFRDYYRKEDIDYVLFEDRYVDEVGSHIDYSLFKMAGTDNDLQECELTELEETKGLPKEGMVIKGYYKPLAVPSIFFDDGEGYGRSVIQGKADIADDIDMALSQASQTVKVSTPAVYIPEDLMDVGKKGQAKAPKAFNRQFIKAGWLYPDGDGGIGGDGRITTDQPQLNFTQYQEQIVSLIRVYLMGWMSPASMGLDLARKDNADAQREKEKATIVTKTNVINQQEDILSELATMLLDIQTWMDKGEFPLDSDYAISVEFKEFANPSFEAMSSILSPMLSSGAISDEMFVDKLYGDSLDDAKKQQEIERIREKRNQARQADSLNLEDFQTDLNL